MLVQLPCGINIRRQAIQSNFIDPLCFRTIVVLLISETRHLFKDSCIFVIIVVFYSKKIQIFFSLIRFVTTVRW